jgi:hypothetical protein
MRYAAHVKSAANYLVAEIYKINLQESFIIAFTLASTGHLKVKYSPEVFYKHHVCGSCKCWGD